MSTAPPEIALLLDAIIRRNLTDWLKKESTTQSIVNQTKSAREEGLKAGCAEHAGIEVGKLTLPELAQHADLTEFSKQETFRADVLQNIADLTRKERFEEALDQLQRIPSSPDITTDVLHRTLEENLAKKIVNLLSLCATV